MARALLVSALLFALLLAGCSGTSTSSHGNPFGGSSSSSVTPATTGTTPINRTGPAPPPVDVAEGADMTQPGSKDFTWAVAPGYRSFTVTLVLSGVSGAPEYEVTNLGYSLIGGGNATTYANQSGGASSSSGPSGTSIVAFNGATATPKADMTGAWKLHLEWQASPAHYDVHVTVHY